MCACVYKIFFVSLPSLMVCGWQSPTDRCASGKLKVKSGKLSAERNTSYTVIEIQYKYYAKIFFYFTNLLCCADRMRDAEANDLYEQC